ncbi:MAG TPA: hypothetical protein VGS41_16175, partial [Chthonomonadales bacterium]|nr:hypothetical protein [Chthonomonadales bacterium]
GAAGVAELIAEHEEAGSADLFRIAWRLAWPGARLTLLTLVEAAVLGANLWFYLRVGRLFGVVGATFFVYLVAVWLGIAHYQCAVLVAQESGRFDSPGRPARRGALAAQRRAALLLLAEPAFSIGLLGVELAVTLVFMALQVPAVLFWLGAISMLQAQAARELLTKYGVIPEPPKIEQVPDHLFRIADGPAGGAGENRRI